MQVRVPAHQIKGSGKDAAANGCHLVTTLSDARRHPSRQLAAPCREGWETESVFAEIKTFQRGARVVLRSRHPTVSSSRSGLTSWSTARCGN